MQKYKKDFVYFMFSRVFFATACIADFHIFFASQCSSKYIGVREIRHTGKVTSRFAHSCPSLWASLPKALGTVTQDFGHPYPCTWVWKPVYVGMSVHGRGQNCSASARCLLGRGNRWHYVAIKTGVIATRKTLYTNRLTISVAIVALK